jgi:hypothetical protein
MGEGGRLSVVFAELNHPSRTMKGTQSLISHDISKFPLLAKLKVAIPIPYTLCPQEKLIWIKRLAQSNWLCSGLSCGLCFVPL